MEILNSHKILVIQTAFIGDAILTLPMIQELKRNKINCTIDVLSIPASSEIFESSTFVNRVIIYDKRGKDKSVSGLIKLIKQIRNEKYDEIYCPHRSFRSALIVLLSDVRQTYGFSNSSFSFAFKSVVEYSRSDHEVKRNLTLGGLDTSRNNWKILPEINVNPVTSDKIRKYLSIGKRYVAVAPGSVWETKKYPKHYFQEIINYLINSGYNVILIGGAADRQYCKEIAEYFPDGNVINATGGFTIPESIEIIKNCKLLICNDSAPTHFGMCANIPVLTIYCSTVPEFGFYPYQERSRYISFNELDCKPCGIHGHNVCPIGTFACAHKISIDEIKLTIEKMLFE